MVLLPAPEGPTSETNEPGVICKFRRSSTIGELLQKFVNYGRRVVILGDVSQAVAGSKALRDFVRESNRGASVWFVPDMAALEARLAA